MIIFLGNVFIECKIRWRSCVFEVLLVSHAFLIWHRCESFKLYTKTVTCVPTDFVLNLSAYLRLSLLMQWGRMRGWRWDVGLTLPRKPRESVTKEADTL